MLREMGGRRPVGNWVTPVSPTPYIRNIFSAPTGLFPAKAGPTKSSAYTTGGQASAGMDAERPGMHATRSVGTIKIKGFPAKAGPTTRASDLLLIFIRKKFRRRQSRLWCRLNAGLAEWAEPHGCGESAVRTWMSVRRGPTERDRSEGTPTKEEPNQEQAPLVTWGAFPSNSPKAKPRPLGRRS